MQRYIENTVTGHRMTFVASPMMGDGDMLVFRGTLPARATGAPLHLHDAMTETFLVEQGALEIDLGGGHIQRLEVGDDIVIAPGTPHGFRNALNRETQFVTTATPGAGLEGFLRTIYALANEGHTDASGAPGVLSLATLMSRTDMTVAGMPRMAQHLLVNGLAALARLGGTAAKVERLARLDRGAA